MRKVEVCAFTLLPNRKNNLNMKKGKKIIHCFFVILQSHCI